MANRKQTALLIGKEMFWHEALLQNLKELNFQPLNNSILAGRCIRGVSLAICAINDHHPDLVIIGGEVEYKNGDIVTEEEIVKGIRKLNPDVVIIRVSGIFNTKEDPADPSLFDGEFPSILSASNTLQRVFEAAEAKRKAAEGPS